MQSPFSNKKTVTRYFWRVCCLPPGSFPPPEPCRVFSLHLLLVIFPCDCFPLFTWGERPMDPSTWSLCPTYPAANPHDLLQGVRSPDSLIPKQTFCSVTPKKPVLVANLRRVNVLQNSTSGALMRGYDLRDSGTTGWGPSESSFVFPGSGWINIFLCLLFVWLNRKTHSIRSHSRQDNVLPQQKS